MNKNMNFHADCRYTDRATKAKYVWLKYRPILKGKILDVGTDECHLKKYLDDETSYRGVGLEGHPDQIVDLENGELPFSDSSFDCVLCLDVLEHLENIHVIFDEVCRVSQQWVIISLPNAWRDFYSMLQGGYYSENCPMKFYNLPLEPPEDRHRWFFSTEEAEKFIAYRAAKNRMRIVQTDIAGTISEGLGIKGLLHRLALSILFKNSANMRNLYTGTLWVAMEKMT